jgi:hypothetical protein
MLMGWVSMRRLMKTEIHTSIPSSPYNSYYLSNQLIKQKTIVACHVHGMFLKGLRVHAWQVIGGRGTCHGQQDGCTTHHLFVLLWLLLLQNSSHDDKAFSSSVLLQ